MILLFSPWLLVSKKQTNIISTRTQYTYYNIPQIGPPIIDFLRYFPILVGYYGTVFYPVGYSTVQYRHLVAAGKNIVWECMKCGMPNFSTSLFDTTASLETHNRFDSLSSLSDPESPIPDIIGPPLQLHPL